jgi:hypothetical protein
MMRRCSMCGYAVPEALFAGDVCQDCADHYDVCGVYFCLGSERGEPF